MLIRIFHEGIVFYINAPEGTRLLADARGRESLLIPEIDEAGCASLRSLPGPLVLEASKQGRMGLSIAANRRPQAHPEVDPEMFGGPRADLQEG